MKTINKLREEVTSILSTIESKKKIINRCRGSKEVSKKNIGNYENVRFQRKENGKISYMIQCSKKSYEGSDYCWKHDNSSKTLDFTTLEVVAGNIMKSKEPVEKKVKSHEPAMLRIIVSKELKNRLTNMNINFQIEKDNEDDDSNLSLSFEKVILDSGDEDSEVHCDLEDESTVEESVKPEINVPEAEPDAEPEADAESDAEPEAEPESEAEPDAESEAEDSDEESMDVSQILTQDGEEYYLNDSTKAVYRLDDDGEGIEIGKFTKVSDKRGAFLYDGEYYCVFDKGTKCVITKRSYKKVEEGFVCK
jgi:hypothetical protein